MSELARGDQSMRERLLESAAQIVAQEGPAALTLRGVAAEAGTSTMAIYTNFGSMPALVDAVLREGFDRLGAHLAAVPRTESALTDLTGLGRAYLLHAYQNPHLYAVMFGATLLGKHDTSAERRNGLSTFEQLVDGVRRVMDDDIIRNGDPDRIAAQFWAAIHGFTLLELAGYLDETDLDAVLVPLLTNLLVGLGAAPKEADDAVQSVRGG